MGTIEAAGADRQCGVDSPTENLMADEDLEGWRWVDVDGVQSAIDEWELVSSLASGTLAPYTLVWRVGWKQWLPACKVDELSSAVPSGSAEDAVEPELDEKQTTPPPPPLDRYNAYRARDAAKLLGGSKRKGPSVLPPPPPGGGMLHLPGRPLTPPPPVPVRRPPMPTLIDAPTSPATATLRPPGAVPPPPRTVPQLRISDPGPEPGPELPTQPKLVEPSYDMDQVVTQRRPQRARSGFPLVLMGGGLAFAAIVVIALGILLYARRDRGTGIATSVSSTPSIPAPTVNTPCTALAKAKKLADPIHFAIPPYLANSNDRIAVGFAASPREGVGLLVDAATLHASERFREKSATPITGVVPLTAGGSLQFALDGVDDSLRFARTINTEPPFAVGVSADGNFARVMSSGGGPQPIWSGFEKARITEPRIATVPEVGHVVTFRDGGQSGDVRVGWLTPDGHEKSKLQSIKVDGSSVGTPMVTANNRDIMVTFAARATPGSYWRVQVATAPHGELPDRAVGFRIPPGGPGAEAISPAATGLSGGRWLVQWTEGSAGNRQVRLQTLAHDLIPVGDPITVSPEGSNAGQGVVWVQGDTALSLFLVKTGNTHELWGAALKCP